MDPFVVLRGIPLQELLDCLGKGFIIDEDNSAFIDSARFRHVIEVLIRKPFITLIAVW